MMFYYIFRRDFKIVVDTHYIVALFTSCFMILYVVQPLFSPPLGFFLEIRKYGKKERESVSSSSSSSSSNSSVWSGHITKINIRNI